MRERDRERKKATNMLTGWSGRYTTTQHTETKSLRGRERRKREESRNELQSKAEKCPGFGCGRCLSYTAKEKNTLLLQLDTGGEEMKGCHLYPIYYLYYAQHTHTTPCSIKNTTTTTTHHYRHHRHRPHCLFSFIHIYSS